MKRLSRSRSGNSNKKKRNVGKRKYGRSPNRQILHATYLFVLMFCVLIGYYGYFLVAKSDEVVHNPYNVARIEKEAERVMRGSILSEQGDVLAMTRRDEEGEESRYYPYGNLFAHTVGYSTRGTTGVESAANGHLVHCSSTVLDQIYNELMGQKNEGDNVIVTLDPELQQILDEAMEGYTGAAVVLEPSTGKVLAMTSTPDFDPNFINETYEVIIADDSNTNLLNKAAQGLYSPGSTFKLLTLLEYIREHPITWENFSYQCNGSIRAGGVDVSCSGGTAHGTVDAKRALELSCNGAFIEMGMTLDKKAFAETCELAGFNKPLSFELPSRASSFKLSWISSDFDTAQTVFGQGETEVTPLHNAMITAAIANGGVMCSPYIISGVETAQGEELEQFASPGSVRIMTEEEAALIGSMMEGVVNNGTGGSVKSDSYQAAAKTGSAEFDSESETHAWLVGYAPADRPSVAVSIVLEKAGSGGDNAGPIAKKIFDAKCR